MPVFFAEMKKGFVIKKLQNLFTVIIDSYLMLSIGIKEVWLFSGGFFNRPKFKSKNYTGFIQFIALEANLFFRNQGNVETYLIILSIFYHNKNDCH